MNGQDFLDDQYEPVYFLETVKIYCYMMDNHVHFYTFVF